MAVTLAALMVSAPVGGARGQATALEDFAGDWSFIGGDRELAQLSSAIDGVADQINLFIREIARSEIHRRIQAERRVRIRVVDQERVAFGLDDWGPVTLPANGRAIRAPSATGETVRISLRFRNGRLIEREVAGQGTRTNVLSVSGDRTRLAMQVSVASDQLPEDIRYRLTYRRH